MSNKTNSNGFDCERAKMLLDYDVIDTPAEPNFDRLTRVAAAVFRAPIATIGLLDHQRYWLKSRVGVDVNEVPRRQSFCDSTIQQGGLFVITDTHQDARFRDAPLVVEAPHIRWYTGAPLITPSGLAIGSICVLDTVPRPAPTTEKSSILADLAGTVVDLLEARLQHRQLAERTAEAARLAAIDPLTGLANRRTLFERLRRALADAGPGRRVALLYIDLDDFKRVNDTMGHPTGDAVLQLVAERLRHAVPADHVVARLGGDEFAIVIPALTNPRDATALGERIVVQMNLPFHLDGRRVRIGACVGVTMAEHAGIEPNAMLRNADVALYRAKQQGGCGADVFMPEPARIAAAS